MADSRAIGVFDSGLGGLTVFSALRQAMPNESMVYLGDTARVPYGTKSSQTVINYALGNAKALLAHQPLKLLVVACNTVSSVALPALQDTLSIPVIGVIEPGAKAAIASQGQSIAVLATAGTIASRAYETMLRQMGFKGELFSKACPLFVPLVEEGLSSGEISESIVAYYLSEVSHFADTVILGCTHYPLLLPTLQKVFAKPLKQPIRWIDSGKETANFVKQELEKQNRLAYQSHVADYHYLVSDAPERFSQLATFYAGFSVEKEDVELIDI